MIDKSEYVCVWGLGLGGGGEESLTNEIESGICRYGQESESVYGVAESGGPGGKGVVAVVEALEEDAVEHDDGEQRYLSISPSFFQISLKLFHFEYF